MGETSIDNEKYEETVKKEKDFFYKETYKNKSKNYMFFFTRRFWDLFLIKVFSILISVKVIGLVSITTLSTYLLVDGYITSNDWMITNTGIWSVIFGMREYFKTSSIRNSINETGEAKNG